jgi:hypothetical protein
LPRRWVLGALTIIIIVVERKMKDRKKGENLVMDLLLLLLPFYNTSWKRGRNYDSYFRKI